MLVTLITGDGRKLPPRLSVEIGREIERLQPVEHRKRRLTPTLRGTGMG